MLDETDNVIHLARSKSSILDTLDRMQAGPEPKPEPEPERESEAELHSPATLADSDLVPQPDDPYKAHARPSNKPEVTLHILLANGDYEGFAWSGYTRVRRVRSEKPGVGPVLVLRFTDPEIKEVWIEGRNFATLHVYLGQNRIAWLRELPRGMMLRDAEEPVITSVEIRTLEK